MYNIAQSDTSSDSQSLITSSFCSANYSLEDKSSSKAAEIRASYGLFSGSASASVSDASISTQQTSTCTQGYDSSKYSSSAKSYTKNIHQGSLDAFNTCQQNAANNTAIKFELIPDSTMQGVAVTLSTSNGSTVTLTGITQIGSGHSICKTQLPARNASSAGRQIIVDGNTTVSVAGNKVTFTCNRELVDDGKGALYADAQTLYFNTSAGTYPVAMAPIGALSRVSIAQAKSEISADLNAKIDANTAAISTNNEFQNGWNNQQAGSIGVNTTTINALTGTVVVPHGHPCPDNYTWYDSSIGSKDHYLCKRNDVTGVIR